MRRLVQFLLLSLFFFLFQPLFAQKMILEYYEGRELVVYTPDYKLILLEELEQGDEIPAGSIIETGRKSTCELRLLPDGTIFKVGDRTTFKIEELQGTESGGKNEFKLIDGAIRAVTSKKTGKEEYIFISGSSSVHPAKADFGMTVKKGWEEKIFVLEGEVKYINAHADEITVYGNQMASGLDDTIKAETMSIRMKRLANTLSFSHLNPGEVGTIREDYPEYTTSTDTPLTSSVPTPRATDPPYTDSTAAPVITNEPTPFTTPYVTPEIEIEPTNVPVEIGEGTESEKSTYVYDPNREELYPADEYAFTATYNYSSDFRIDEIDEEYVIISYALPEETAEGGEESAEQEESPEIPEYTLFEIYNVYERKENLKGKDVYLNYIDSVFLEKVEDMKFYFALLWQGAKKNIKPGYYLYPTGRLYSYEEDSIIIFPEDEQDSETEDGDGEIVEDRYEFPHQSGKSSNGGNNGSGIGLYIDMGISLTVGFFDLDTGLGSDADFLANLLLMLVSARGRYFVDTTFKFTSWFGIGAELSFATMSFEGVYFLDFPLRGYVRFGSRDAYIQPYCGYYFSLALPEGGEFDTAYIDGIDVGITASLWGFYLEGSYIFGEVIGHMNYFRAGIGIVFNDIF